MEQYFESKNKKFEKKSAGDSISMEKCPASNLNMSIHVDCNELEVINDKVYQVNVLHEIA